MEGRFGFKDLVLLCAIVLVGLLVVLQMVQEDRRWEEIRTIRSELERQQRVLGEMSRRLGNGAPAAAPPADESWAREGGGEIVRLDPLKPGSDPRGLDDYSRGGELRVILRSEPRSLTPYQRIDAYTYQIVDEIVCEQMADYDWETLELRGVLARAYQEATDGTWVRILLDERARFSDAAPVTAEDVRYTIEDYIGNAEIDVPVMRSVLENVSGVEVVNEHVVEVRFHEARFDNVATVLRLSVLPAHFYGALSASEINGSTGLLMGSGPYRLADREWTPGKDVVLVRNEHSWREFVPAFERVRFTAVRDDAARLAAFEEGLGDVMRATPEQFVAKSASAGFEDEAHLLSWNNMRSGYGFIAWNCAEGSVFHDARVRRAMTRLIDRERIVRDFYEGLGKVATGPFNSVTEQADPTIVALEHDPMRAERLLEEAGWADRDGNGVRENLDGEDFEFEYMHIAGSTVGPRLGAYLKDRCAEVGIRCEVRSAEFGTFLAMRDNGEFDALSLKLSWTTPESDPLYLWHSSQIGEGGSNFARWSNERADELIERGRRTMDEDARMEVWHELHRVIHEEQPFTFTVETPWLRFVSRRIGNVRAYPRGMNLLEWYIPGGEG